MTQQQPTKEEIEAAAQAQFQRRTDMLAQHMMGVFIVTNVPILMVINAASQMIRASLMHLAPQDRKLAQLVVEDLAAGVVEMANELADAAPAEGQAQQ
jgi:hypothetical protein